MSKDAKPAAAEGGEAAPKKNKKLLIIILAAVLVLVLGGGAAAFMLLKGGDHAEEEEAAEHPPKKKEKEKKKETAHPVFVNLDPFTVNLIPENGDQYLQVAISIEFTDPSDEGAVKAHMPKIRNNLTLLLSSKKASELVTKEGKEILADELRDAINDVLEPPRTNRKTGEVIRSGLGPAKEVLFTSFIIQ